jgi:hypothetical protein
MISCDVCLKNAISKEFVIGRKGRDATKWIVFVKTLVSLISRAF